MRLLKGTESLSVWCSRTSSAAHQGIKGALSGGFKCQDREAVFFLHHRMSPANEAWPLWFSALQVCAILSLLSSGSYADLTCEALLMLSGNVSCKSEDTHQLHVHHNTTALLRSTVRRECWRELLRSDWFPAAAEPPSSITTFPWWISENCLLLMLRADIWSILIVAC